MTAKVEGLVTLTYNEIDLKPPWTAASGVVYFCVAVGDTLSLNASGARTCFGVMMQIELSKRTIKVLGKSVSEAFLVPFREMPRVLFHGLILGNIIAGFWLLDSMKDPILASTVGIEYQPIAKFISVLTTLVVVCIYDFLTSVVSKPTLFHIISFFFGMATMIMSALLSDPVIGLSNRSDKGSHRILGWISYFTIEAYGSLMVALFWSFTNSIMDLEQAKGAYGLIISIAQVGAVAGSTLATNSGKVGIPRLYLFGSMSIFSVSILIKSYHIVFRDHATESVKVRVRSFSESETSVSPIRSQNIVKPTFLSFFINVFRGFYEGLMLIVRHKYILKLAGVSCLYEIVVTVLDYQFKILGANHSSTHGLHGSSSISVATAAGGLIDQTIGDGDRFASLLGQFGQLTNIVSFFVSFFGFSFLVHRIGVKHSLLVFPAVLFLAVVITNLVPSLWVLFTMVSIIKALSFSLNEPVKELLYIPTSQPIKFKAKAWIDVFGCRLAKAAGSFITHIAHGNSNKLRAISEIPCLLISLFILLLAWQIGTEFQYLTKENIIIGDENLTFNSTQGLPTRKGLNPGDVGYDGYNLGLFEGTFDDSEMEDDDNDSITLSILSSKNSNNTNNNNNSKINVNSNISINTNSNININVDRDKFSPRGDREIYSDIEKSKRENNSPKNSQNESNPQSFPFHEFFIRSPVYTDNETQLPNFFSKSNSSSASREQIFVNENSVAVDISKPWKKDFDKDRYRDKS